MFTKLPKTVKRKKRLGRGIASKGAKSGRGMKGQRSRAGARIRPGFEGGQTALYQRVPKGRGTKQIKSSQVKKPISITLKYLESMKEGSVVGPGLLRERGVIKKKGQQVKLIGNSGLSKKLTVRVHKASAGAIEAVKKAGGRVEIINKG